MPSIEKFCERMRYWCEDGNLGYDQMNRWDIRPGGECDCSSLVIFALREAGFDTGSATYTGNLSDELTERGWLRLYPALSQIKPGDILLNDAYHVAAVISGYGWNARVAQASIDENGNISGGASGDQGNETNIVDTYSYPWNCILRYPYDDSGDSEPDYSQPTYNVMVDNEWLPDMIGTYDTGGSSDFYAGIFGKPFTYLTISDCTYRVKTYDSDTWLEWVTKRDLNDLVYGAAGDDGYITHVEILEDDIKYRVHVLNGSWLPYMIGRKDTGGSDDTFAGNGKLLDAIEIVRI